MSSRLSPSDCRIWFFGNVSTKNGTQRRPFQRDTPLRVCTRSRQDGMSAPVFNRVEALAAHEKRQVAHLPFGIFIVFLNLVV